MIIHDGIKYVLRGTAEDNGQYDHYYYTDTIKNTYDIIYEGKRAVLTKTYKVYINEETDQMIKRDYFVWEIQCNGKKFGGGCFSAAEEAEIDKLIQESGTDGGDTPNGGNGNGDNGGNGNNGDKGDEPDDLGPGNNGDGDDNKKGIFDDTTGNKVEPFNRSQLPLGADIQNPKIDETGLCIYEIANYSLRHEIFSVYTWSEDKLICSYKIHVITNSLSLNEVYRMEIPTDQDCAEYLLEYFGFDKNLDDICFYIREDSSRNLSAPSEELFNNLPDMLVSLIAYNIK